MIRFNTRFGLLPFCILGLQSDRVQFRETESLYSELLNGSKNCSFTDCVQAKSRHKLVYRACQPLSPVATVELNWPVSVEFNWHWPGYRHSWAQNWPVPVELKTCGQWVQTVDDTSIFHEDKLGLQLKYQNFVHRVMILSVSQTRKRPHVPRRPCLCIRETRTSGE